MSISIASYKIDFFYIFALICHHMVIIFELPNLPYSQHFILYCLKYLICTQCAFLYIWNTCSQHVFHKTAQTWWVWLV